MARANSKKKPLNKSRLWYRGLTKKKPVMCVADLNFKNWLAILLQSDRAADSLIAEFGTDINAIKATPIQLLTSLPYVGEAVALKLMAASNLFDSSHIMPSLSDAIPEQLEV